MTGLSYSQVSGNDWSTPPAEMLYDDIQPVAPKPAVSQPRFDEQYAQRIGQQIEKQLAQFEAEHEVAIANLRRQFVFLDEESIRTFLRTHRTAPQVLMQAVPHLHRNFGADTVFRLQATTDEYGAETLYATVVWPGNLQDIRASLDRFDDQWWIVNSHQASGDITFTYELV